MTPAGIQYVTDEQGNTTSVIVPIDLWREIISEDETVHLLKSDRARKRLLATKEGKEGILFNEIANYWLNAAQPSLDSIWDNEEDDIYAQLLEE